MRDIWKYFIGWQCGRPGQLSNISPARCKVKTVIYFYTFSNIQFPNLQPTMPSKAFMELA